MFSCAATTSPTVDVEFLIDSGSNVNMFNDSLLAQLAQLHPDHGIIGGVGSGVPWTHIALADATPRGNSANPGASCAPRIDPVSLALLYTPRGTRNILSESVLLDYGITAPKSPARHAPLNV